MATPIASGAAGFRRKYKPLAATTDAGASGNVEADQSVAGRISGTGLTTRRRTPAENAAITEFDKTAQRLGVADHGFGPTSIQKELASAQLNHAARIAKDPYDIGPYAEDTTGTFGSQQKAGGGMKEPASVPVAPVNARPGGLAVSAVGSTSALDAAGAGVVKGPLAAVTNGPYNRVAQFEPAPGSALKSGASPDAPTPVVAPTSTPAATPTGTPAATATGLPGPQTTPSSVNITPNPPVAPSPTPGTGRTTEAGVSNSQSAGFQQPTQDKPVPTTPTSPVMDSNDLDRRNKKPFAGF